jgi:hypothetical protein
VNEKFIVPHAMCEMGEMLLEKPDHPKLEAKEYFLQAKGYPQPYDFDKPLGIRISKGLQRVAMDKV